MQLPASIEPYWPIGQSALHMKGAGWLYCLNGHAEPGTHALHMDALLGARQLLHVGWHLPTQREVASGSTPSGHASRHWPPNQKGRLLFRSHEVQLLSPGPLQVRQLASQLAIVSIGVT